MSEQDVTAGTKVTIANWDGAPKPAQPILTKKTTVKTYVISGAAPAPGNNAWVQICDYEPSRVRLVIGVYDNDVAITTEAPMKSPDADAVGVAPQGAFLPASLNYRYEFFGPDAFYINPLNAAAARVTVIKEYC